MTVFTKVKPSAQPCNHYTGDTKVLLDTPTPKTAKKCPVNVKCKQLSNVDTHGEDALLCSTKFQEPTWDLLGEKHCHWVISSRLKKLKKNPTLNNVPRHKRSAKASSK